MKTRNEDSKDLCNSQDSFFFCFSIQSNNSGLTDKNVSKSRCIERTSSSTHEMHSALNWSLHSRNFTVRGRIWIVRIFTITSSYFFLSHTQRKTRWISKNPTSRHEIPKPCLDIVVIQDTIHSSSPQCRNLRLNLLQDHEPFVQHHHVFGGVNLCVCGWKEHQKLQLGPLRATTISENQQAKRFRAQTKIQAGGGGAAAHRERMYQQEGVDSHGQRLRYKRLSTLGNIALQIDWITAGS